ncbi:MAG: hypothetical protein KAR40_00270 [Candidatus Sabulitectum sp.]|nr:hypothetical protein [Candidatus Sabulitectum sp.]
MIPGREITTDTLLLAELAGTVSCGICFDLGTGTGEVLNNANLGDAFTVGIDISIDALRMFNRAVGQPFLCSVGMVSSIFRKGCADLVLANPPYNIADNCRNSPDPLRHEARAGGPLLLYRFIFAGAHLLKPGGCMIITGRLNRSREIECGLRAAGFHRMERFERGRVAAVKAVLLQHS